MSKEGAARLGIKPGTSYGGKVDILLGEVGHNFTRKDFLALAWACVDQASSSVDTQRAAKILGLIEEMNDAESDEEEVAEPEVKLSKDEERVLLLLHEEVLGARFLSGSDLEIAEGMQEKGVVTVTGGFSRRSIREGERYVRLTELGMGVVQMAGAS